MVPETGEMLAIRVVYDGPPESGKTTSLRALAGSLAQPLFSPEEVDGRTLLFDWVEYVGGSFDGHPIRCQIVSVPGQSVLAERRMALLATADAVVFVADTRDSRRLETRQALLSLQKALDGRPLPRPGIVVQANQRDRADAIPLAELHDAFDHAGFALVESVAPAGAGIREAFVLAVRLALDRARELQAAGQAVTRPEAATPEELRRQIQDLATGAPSLARAPMEALLRAVVAGEAEAHRRPASAPAGGPAEARIPGAPEAPRLPDSTVPSGRLWPPVEGRLMLHAAALANAAAERQPDGYWRAQAGRWRLLSAAEHDFHDVEAGKAVLLRWARLHSRNADRLSPRRCIALADTGAGTWRLWQIVHAEESLRQRLSRALNASDPDLESLAAEALACARTLLQAREIFAAAPRLPCRIATTGLVHSAPAYVGMLPPESWGAADEDFDLSAAAFLRRELQPLLRAAPPDLMPALAGLTAMMQD